MLDRHYFETVLREQIQWMSGAVNLQVQLHNGRTLQVRSVFAAHDRYVIFQVYPEGGAEVPKRPGWDRKASEAGFDPWVFDQVAVPYGNIASTDLTVRSAKEEAKEPVGFKVDAQRGPTAPKA